MPNLYSIIFQEETCSKHALLKHSVNLCTHCIHISLHFLSVAGAGEAAGGPARLHRPPQHPGEQVLQHDAEQQRGGEAVDMKKKKKR